MTTTHLSADWWTTGEESPCAQ